MTKTVGIAADDYKLSRFENKLNEAGFSNYKIVKMTQKSSLIQVIVPEEKVEDVKQICVDVEAFFKNRAN